MKNHLCDNCGNALEPNAVFCPHCGAAVFRSTAAAAASPSPEATPEEAPPQPLVKSSRRKWLPFAAIALAAVIAVALGWGSLSDLFASDDPVPSTEQTAPQTTPSSDPTEPPTTIPPTTTAPTEATRPKDLPLEIPSMPDDIVGVRLEDNILQRFQSLLMDPYHLEYRNFFNMATLSNFDSPENVNLYWLLSHGIYIGESPLTEEERTHFAAQLESNSPSTGYSPTITAYRIAPEDIDAVLAEYFGITLESSNKVGLDQLEYWDKTGCYYLFRTYANHNSDIEVVSGELRSADTIRLCYYSPGAYRDAGLPQSEHDYGWYITLQATENGYRILSNIASSQKEPDPLVIPTLPSAEPGTALTKEQLGQFQLMLTSNGGSERNYYKQALVTIFSDPSEIDLCDLIYNGIGQKRTLTEEERAYILTSTSRPLSNAYCFTSEDIDAVLTKYFGISLASHKTGLDGFLHWEKTGYYYWSPFDSNGIFDLRVIGGELLSTDTVRIDYISGINTAPQSVTFQITDDRCIILSNLPASTTTDPEPPQVMYEMDEQCAKTAMKAYFAQRQQFIQGESTDIPMAYDPLFRDEVKHLEAIQSHCYELLFSYITVSKASCWDNMSEVFATETCAYLIKGEPRIFTIDHVLHVGIGKGNLPEVISDGYMDTAVDFISCSYVPPET